MITANDVAAITVQVVMVCVACFVSVVSFWLFVDEEA
jgi:hypothetical protein